MVKMKTKSFGEFAKYYDQIYRSKDYGGECDFLEEIFARYPEVPIKTILDIGCGTGGHAIPLHKRGYEVTGIDKSGDMILKAREKAPEIEFRHGDVRTFLLPEGRLFDACISMFNVIGYITRKDDLLKAFRHIRTHLRNSSLFVFDIWNEEAVLHEGPGYGFKQRGDITEIATSRLNTRHKTIKIGYTILPQGVAETHVVKYFNLNELAELLKRARFEVLKVCPFMKLDEKPNKNTWSTTIITGAC